MVPIELKFVRKPDSDYYYVYYRIKDFVPVEIMTKTLIQKCLRRIFHVKKYTKNPWKSIKEFIYLSNKDTWIYNRHPKNFITEFSVHFKNIESTKDKFKYLENITAYELKEQQYYEKMVKAYNQKENELKAIIY